ncbi:MAG TPA: hypothetical protein VFA95_09280 [Gammaproteobacteria bacterium]|nr:hypothetical protein [Gammaproteobacteria bacterium]
MPRSIRAPIQLEKTNPRYAGDSLASTIAAHLRQATGQPVPGPRGDADGDTIASAYKDFGRLIQDIRTAEAIIAAGADGHPRDQAERRARAAAERAGWSDRRIEKAFYRARKRSAVRPPGNPFLPAKKSRRAIAQVARQSLEAGARYVTDLIDRCVEDGIRDPEGIAAQVRTASREQQVRRDGLVERARVVLRSREELERDRVAWTRLACRLARGKGPVSSSRG